MLPALFSDEDLISFLDKTTEDIQPAAMGDIQLAEPPPVPKIVLKTVASINAPYEPQPAWPRITSTPEFVASAVVTELISNININSNTYPEPEKSNNSDLRSILDSDSDEDWTLLLIVFQSIMWYIKCDVYVLHFFNI